METKTELVWHHVTHEGGVATGLPEGETRNLLVFTSCNETVMIEFMHWSDGDSDLKRGFWRIVTAAYFVRRNNVYIVAWAELPQPSDVLTDEEKELYS